MSETSVRRMRQGDMEQVERIEQASFSMPWSRQALEEELSNPAAVYYVAERSGQILGYVGMHSVLGEGYITNVAVAPEERGKKIGTALLGELLKWCTATGHHFVTLEVRASNDSARRLYENFGFQPMGIRKNFYQRPQENAVIMTRFLKE